MKVRYGQLSYTCFDAADTAGGWQVKETNGNITADEARLLVGGVHTTLNPAGPVPRYPTLQQLRTLPRRLAYRRINANTAVYWHTAPAGRDSTGRPGNIFAHIVLDRDAARPGTSRRPIQLWGSPGWLTPYGDHAVAGATLPGEVPPAGGAITADRAVQFCCDTVTWRLGTLCGLLDAIAAGLGGGPAVVLGTETADIAAQWIGAVSFLMSPGTAGRLNFSTFDRAAELACAPPVGQHLVAVPRSDLGGVPPGVVVIDAADTMSVGALHGQPHRTAGGQNIEVTEWSAMTQVVLSDPESAALLLADIDEISSRVVDIDLPPWLPMAMAVAGRRRWADAAAEARSVLIARTRGADIGCPGEPSGDRQTHWSR